jgi:hypothetical protein
MRNLLLTFCFLSGIFMVSGQDLSPGQILDKSISYHDPNGVWGSFEGSFIVRMDTPERPPRLSEITMDQNEARFRLHVQQGDDEKTYELNGQQCTLHLNGKEDFSEADAKTHRLTCESAKMYRDYYSYLYGLPMKLRDPGTRISPEVEKRTFQGKEYWVLEVNYDPEVGKDLWYFYFDPESFAMEAYQFYHDKAKNDGEYIMLEGEFLLNQMRLPKTRHWYTNREAKHLGTDILQDL